MPAYDLTFAYECLLIDKAAADYGLVSQAGIMSDIASGVENFVKNNFDTAHPIKSIINEFMIPGVLWMVSPLLGGAYEIAIVAGWDANAFWTDIENSLESYVLGLKSDTANKPSDEDINQKVQGFIDAGLNKTLKDNTSNTPTPEQTQKLESISTKMKTASLNANLIVQAVAEYQNNRKHFIKTAGWLSLILKPLAGFLAKTIGWIFRRALYGLGLTAAAGLASTFLGTNTDKTQSGDTAAKEQAHSDIANLIPASKSAPQDLYDFHYNTITSTWVENGDIADVPATIMDWVESVYPQLKKYEGDIESSSAFRLAVSQISHRNHLGRGAGFYIIPPPYERKIDIVSNIVSKFIDEHVKSLS